MPKETPETFDLTLQVALTQDQITALEEGIYAFEFGENEHTKLGTPLYDAFVPAYGPK